MSNQATRQKGRGPNRKQPQSGFRTDSDIGAGAGDQGGTRTGQRKLEKWQAGGAAEGPALGALDDHKPEKWDQFEVNSRKFGVKDTFDEHLYTTAIDKSHPEYAERARKAERLAREIEGQSTTNVHQAEERGQKTEEVDEESKYSGVERSSTASLEQQEQTQRAADDAEFKKKPGKKFNFAASAAKAASFRPVQQQQFFVPPPYDPMQMQYGQPVMMPYGYPPQQFQTFQNHPR